MENYKIKIFPRAKQDMEEVIDYLNDELKQRHVRRLRSGECSVELGFVL